MSTRALRPLCIAIVLVLAAIVLPSLGGTAQASTAAEVTTRTLPSAEQPCSVRSSTSG